VGTCTVLNTEVLYPYYVTLLGCTKKYTSVKSSKTYTFLTQRFFIFSKTVYILTMTLLRYTTYISYCQKDVLSPDVLSLRTFCPAGCFVRRTFCPAGRFVPPDVLSHGRYVSGCFVSRRFVSGRFVSGRFVSVRFVWAPCCLMLRTMVQIHWEWFSYILQHYCMNVGIL
jgi:hypothetical protein